MTTIAAFCPSTESIFLDTPQPEVMSGLKNFTKLKKLKLNKVSYSLMVETLQMMPHQVTIIELGKRRHLTFHSFLSILSMKT